MAIDERAQAVLVEAADLACHQLHAGDILCLVRLTGCAAAHRGLHLQLLEFPREPACVILQRGDACRHFGWSGVERRGNLGQLIAFTLKGLQRFQPGDGLDAADARRHARLRDDGEEADVAGGLDVRAAAQLHAEAGNRDHAHGVAVLLAEERRRTSGDRVLRILHLGLDACVLQDLLVDDLLDLEDLVTRQRAEMLEVEAQAIRRNE